MAVRDVVNLCDSCVYFQPRTGIQGYCRRYAPQVPLQAEAVLDPRPVATWPIVTANDWCGEYKSETAPPDVPPTGAYNLFDPVTTPAAVDVSEVGALTLGVQFTSSVAGAVTAVRFYKSLLDTGSHIGSLWTSAGDLLATGFFETETNVGWQQLNFTAPVDVAAGVTYVASYYSPKGVHAEDQGYFTGAYVMGPLTVPANGGCAALNPGGVAGSYFPSNNDVNNYWVDIVLET